MENSLLSLMCSKDSTQGQWVPWSNVHKSTLLKDKDNKNFIHDKLGLAILRKTSRFPTTLVQLKKRVANVCWALTVRECQVYIKYYFKKLFNVCPMHLKIILLTYQCVNWFFSSRNRFAVNQPLTDLVILTTSIFKMGHCRLRWDTAG